MCGIVGFIERVGGTRQTAEIVRRMASAITHRGPDDAGAWIDVEAGVALAHRRLSIIDLSPAGHQPMLSADGRRIIVFNGEIYNYVALRAELDEAGQQSWRGHSDTEVLLAAIDRWGIKDALKRCVGMFAIAVWDVQQRTLTLARDRIGEKPLYYGRVGTCFAFASELKALRQHPNWSHNVSRDSLTLLLRHSYVPAPYTIYDGIAKLGPGQILVVSADDDQPRLDSYWSAHDSATSARATPFLGNRHEAVETLDKLLRQALNGQMMADVPLGAFLSGGVDSSTVVAVMQSISSQPIRTFTIGFDVAAYNEAEYARKVAGHLGTKHTELYLTEREALDIIPKIPEIYCEPFSDPSQIPTFLVSQLARQHITVSLSGDGGDELFSGYTRYQIAARSWDYLSRVPGRLRQAAANLATWPPPATYDRIGQPVMAFLPPSWRQAHLGDKIHKAAELLSLQSLDDVYRRLCTHWSQPTDLVIGAREPPTMLSGLAPIPELAGPIERMMYQDLVSYLPDNILVKVDRASMAASLESRVPFLDHRIVEFAMSLPLSVSWAEGMPKWPLRQILYRHVPRELIERPKMGFGVPIDRWLRGALREWAEDLLAEQRLKREGFFRPEPIRQAWLEHLSGSRNHQYALWNVLMFQAWTSAQSQAQSAICDLVTVTGFSA